MLRRLLFACAVLALPLGAVACGDTADEARDVAEEAAEDAGDAARDAADRAEDVVNDRNVTIRDNKYDPASRTISVGTEITWVNRDENTHTVTSDNDVFETEENLGTDDEFSHRFTQAGTYDYHCEVHGEDEMSGTIIVE
jgi:plastocyanin